MAGYDSRHSIIAQYYEAHHDDVARYVAHCLKRPGTAEDIVQDTFLRILNSKYMITPVTMPGLVYKIARNIVTDRWRRRHAAEEHMSRMTHTALAGNTLDTAHVYGYKELKELLDKGIARLKEGRRDIYRINVSGGGTVSDISAMFGLNYKTTESRLVLARKEVRKYIARMLA